MIGVGSLFLLQGIFPTLWMNSGLLHCRQILYHVSHQGSLIKKSLDTFCHSKNFTIFSQFSSVQSLSRVRLFATPWIAARQASLSTTNSRSSLRLASIESVMPSLKFWCVWEVLNSNLVVFQATSLKFWSGSRVGLNVSIFNISVFNNSLSNWFSSMSVTWMINQCYSLTAFSWG